MHTPVAVLSMYFFTTKENGLEQKGVWALQTEKRKLVKSYMRLFPPKQPQERYNVMQCSQTNLETSE